jgi:hypothetical protein
VGGNSINLTVEGIIDKFTRKYITKDLSSYAERTQKQVAPYITEGPCRLCRGARLSQAALGCRIDGYNIADLSSMEIAELAQVVGTIESAQNAPVIRPRRPLWWLRRLRPETAQHRGPVPHALQRLQDVGKLRRQRPDGRRLPLSGRHAVRKEHTDEPRLRLSGGLCNERAGRHHGLDERQRECDAGPSQKRSTRQVSLRDERHGY